MVVTCFLIIILELSILSLLLFVSWPTMDKSTFLYYFGIFDDFYGILRKNTIFWRARGQHNVLAIWKISVYIENNV